MGDALWEASFSAVQRGWMENVQAVFLCQVPVDMRKSYRPWYASSWGKIRRLGQIQTDLTDKGGIENATVEQRDAAWSATREDK
jgi:hypothetical protein